MNKKLATFLFMLPVYIPGVVGLFVGDCPLPEKLIMFSFMNVCFLCMGIFFAAIWETSI